MIKSFYYTDKGPRAENEDSLKININNEFVISCVADGVGGEKCGKLASGIAVDYFVSLVSSFDQDLRQVIEEVHEKIRNIQKDRKECNGMATTFTACVLSDSNLKGVHIGDSRLCILRGNGLKQLTESHTEVYRFANAGKIRNEDIESYPRKHILESAIGINRALKIQNFSFDLLKGDRILLTSDGVHEVISKIEFRDLSIVNPDLQDYGNRIVDLLKQKALKDNVSFILNEIK